jgi:Tfp pilus assembly PilM family ATPase
LQAQRVAQMPETKIIPFRAPKLHYFRRRFRVRKAGHITALDIDGPMLRLVQADVRGDQPAITRVAAVPLNISAEDRSDAESLGNAVRAALESAKVKPGFVVMGVPRAQVILRTVALPASDDLSELAAMVHLQIGKDLPFRKDDAVIDFRVRPQPKVALPPSGASPEAAPPEGPAAPKVEALVAVAQREVVQFHRQVAAAAGLKLVGLGLHSYANARCLEACRVAEGSEAVALVSLRPGEVIVDVISERSLLFSRGAAVEPQKHDVNAPPIVEPPAPQAPPVEPAPPPEPFNFVDAVTIEVVRSLHSYSGMQPANAVAKVVVTGATGHEQDVISALQNRLTVPVALLDVASALKLGSNDRETASGAMSAVGLALGIADAEGLPFDFLHPKRPPVQRDMRRIRAFAGAAAAVLAVFAVIGVRSHLINKRLAVQRQIQSDLTVAQKMQPLYRQVRAQHATIDEWLKEGQEWLEHYMYLSAILPGPEEIYITSLSVGGQGTIRLSVQAKSGEILARLDKQLRAAGYEVKPQAITPGADKFGYDFRSSVELLVPAKMKIDLTKLKPPPRPADDGSLDGAKPTARLRKEVNVATTGGGR